MQLLRQRQRAKEGLVVCSGLLPCGSRRGRASCLCSLPVLPSPPLPVKFHAVSSPLYCLAPYTSKQTPTPPNIVRGHAEPGQGPSPCSAR